MTGEGKNRVLSPFSPRNSITIKSGVTLTVNPGVIIRVANGQEISVYGGLIINGNPIKNVEITSSALFKAEGDCVLSGGVK
ncbi:hypothetical protein HY792_06315 [Candidatus Desantisbacteria bacterium]|nr:hypothetical protein [Candidatus Desantisbacteria bacterium]